MKKGKQRRREGEAVRLKKRDFLNKNTYILNWAQSFVL